VEQVEFLAGGQHQVQLLVPHIPGDVDQLHLNTQIGGQLGVHGFDDGGVVFLFGTGNHILDGHHLIGGSDGGGKHAQNHDQSTQQGQPLFHWGVPPLINKDFYLQTACAACINGNRRSVSP
jgi:hypothetical protein